MCVCIYVLNILCFISIDSEHDSMREFRLLPHEDPINGAGDNCDNLQGKEGMSSCNTKSTYCYATRIIIA